jgi:hypothetical protein
LTLPSKPYSYKRNSLAPLLENGLDVALVMIVHGNVTVSFKTALKIL